ncbi:ATP-binding protein [Streptomyces sp. DSM 110735]|uniref:sensor histidine kinase n=1 Tax=Streptomyces sp. DSM 110735 TaxID=2775031 RepID=UPI001A7E34DF|nr:ATP-binding protein [Streptomyces sp. DSM 110735]
MSVPAPSVQHRSTAVQRSSWAVPAAVVAVTAVAAGVAVAVAPSGTHGWALVVAGAGWACVAVAVLVGHLLVRRARLAAATQAAENDRLRTQAQQTAAQTSHLASVTLPSLHNLVLTGSAAADALAGVSMPNDQNLRRLAHLSAGALEEAVSRAAAADKEARETQEALNELLAEADRLTRETLPAAVARLAEGRSADTVLGELTLPRVPLMHDLGELVVRELARSERRAGGARIASTKALSRVQAKAVSMLADLRAMQDEHDGTMLGDLMRLDHRTSQLVLIADRLALLMGGKTSRTWNKPIRMESILRGAIGRIAAYQRVRLHFTSQAAISGFAAEGVMHLLAELIDNAANFSPPTDEVHVYVEEHRAGIVVTVEDSGLTMSEAAMKHAEGAVAGSMADLASLQGTRLGLAVVGLLALKYRINVSYRPSSRGGTGVVVLLPRRLIAQQRDPWPARREATRTATVQPVPAPETPTAAPVVETPVRPDPPVILREVPEQTRHEPPAAAPTPAPVSATPNGLPVRKPGRTMSDAERAQRPASKPAPPRKRPAHDVGSRFGAFHRSRKSSGDTLGGRPDPEPPTAG